tara:strand:- start:5240 stop:5515 length:276 start_codon:yes stop_codon:yes gene_type:complete
MSGFLLAIGVSAFLTLVSGMFIWYSRQISGPSSVNIIQTGMFVKFMLGACITFFVINEVNVNPYIFGMTFGIYVCTAFPVVAYMMVKNDFK